MKLVCPNCGTQYESGKFCQECGAKLQEVTPELICPSCGYKTKTGKFCPECGTKLTEQIVAQEEPPKNETTERKFNERDPRFAKYYDRKGFPRTIPQEERDVAIEELTPFANQDIAEAKMLLGGILMSDPKNEDTVFKAFNLLKEAEEAGDKFAYYLIGYFYYMGAEPLLEQNHSEAEKRMLELYKEYDNGDAAQLLAELYAFSEEKCDYKKAFEYATIAAEDDQERGYFVLGALYLNGWGVEKNANLALDNYKMAAAFGDKTAMNQIGFIYMGDEGIEEDPKQSFYWFNEAAKKGSDAGMFNLGCCFRDGFGIEADAEQAADWFKKAAELGCVDAMCELGDYYQGTLVDIKKAKLWYLKAAELGNAEAQYELAICLDREKNYKEAIKWYKKAIEQYHPLAYLNLGEYYCDGVGVKKNIKKAKELFFKAAELGNAAALNRLGVFYADIENNFEEAIKWYKKAIEKDFPWAYRNYALSLWFGHGVMENKEQAIETMQKAMTFGCPEAKDDLDWMQQPLAIGKMPDKMKSDTTVAPNELHIPKGTKKLSTLNALNNHKKNWKQLITILYLPDSLISIKESVLNSLPNLERIIIPNGKLPKYGKMLPSDWWRMYYEDGTHSCPNITIPKGKLFVYPYGVENIINGRYSNNHVLIPPTCVEISKNAFQYNNEILSITMTDSVETIGKSAFESCKKLKFIRLSNKLTTIPKSMVKYCDSLTEIIIPEGVTSIERAAFSSCDNLTKIVLPSTINQIDKGGTWGLNPFQLNKSLKQIIIPKDSKRKFQSLLQGFSGNPANLLVCSSNEGVE